MNLSCFYNKKMLDALAPIAPLFLRIWVAQEFFFAGYGKVTYGFTAPQWFAGLDFPPVLNLLPVNINWFMAGYGEVIFSIMLLIGLVGRFAAIGLIFITYVAVYTVHYDLGLSGWNQIETSEGLGFKVPLMLGMMQCSLLFSGMGKWSIDHLLVTKCCTKYCTPKKNETGE